MRVVLVKGVSGYGVLPCFVDALAAAFCRRGLDAHTVEAQPHMSLAELVRNILDNGSVDLLHTFNVFGETRDGEGRTLGALTGATHVIHYVDHPLNHGSRLDATSSSACLLFVDQTHAEAVRHAYGPDRFAHLGFCPHAAIGDPTVVEPTPAAYDAARPIPVLFAGTFYRGGAKLWQQFNARTARIFDAAYEIAITREFVPAHCALRQAMEVEQVEPESSEYRKVLANAHLVHEEIRQERRFLMLKTAAKAGVPLHVYGKGYEKHLYRFKNVTFGGSADFKKVLDLMRLSRVVLNVNANFGKGSHERPLSAMVAGAAAASDYSGFYAEAFREGEEIALYRWSNLLDDLSRIAEIARDAKAAHAIASAGQRRAVADHTWDARLGIILKAAGFEADARAAA